MKKIKITEEEADRFEACFVYVLERLERQQREHDLARLRHIAEIAMDHLKAMEKAKAWLVNL